MFSLVASFAGWGQTQDRVFQFRNTDSDQNFLEAATLIRTIADIQRVKADEAKRSLELSGTGQQMALAEWLFQELDRPQPANLGNKGTAVREYTMDSGPENVVRIFYLTNTKTVQNFQEVATLVRTIADIRRVFTYNAPRAMVARSTAEQIATAAWVVNALDQSADAEYHMAASTDPHGETVVHVFHIAHAVSVQDFQEVATAIRTIGDIRRVFTYNDPRIMVTRTTAEQTALVQWLVQQMDHPAMGQPGAVTVQSSGVYEYQTPYDSDSTVRIFYLRSPTVEEFQKTAVRIRTETGIRRVFTYNAPRTMAVRGNVNQVAMAARLVAELDALQKK
jgi:hypothetical protein